MTESWGGSGSGWGNPVVGSTALRIPAINSPNFNLANPTASPSPSWAILQSGLAYFFGLVLSGGTITGPDYIINTSGIFIYSGTPALGNLVGSWASAVGTDQFGNAYAAGLTVGSNASSTPQIALVPAPGGPGSAAQLQFPLSPAASFSQPPNVAGSSLSSSGQLFVSGPALAAAGETDWVQIAFRAFQGSTPAHLDIIYVDANGTPHPYLTVNQLGITLSTVAALYGTHPGTYTNTSPAVAESWQTLSLINGWTGTGGVNGVRYRMLPIGAGLIEIEGDITSANTGNSTVGNMGTGYHPPATRNRPAGINNVAVNNSQSTPWIFVNTNGDIAVIGIPVANVETFFHIFVPMD